EMRRSSLVGVDAIEERRRIVDAGDQNQVLPVRGDRIEDRTEGVVAPVSRRKPGVHQHALGLIEDDESFGRHRGLPVGFAGADHRVEERKPQRYAAGTSKQSPSIQETHASLRSYWTKGLYRKKSL